MARPNPETSTILVTTITGRYGGSFGNYENVSTVANSSAGVVPFYRSYSSLRTPNYFIRLLTRQELPMNGYIVVVDRTSGDSFRQDQLSHDGWTYFTSISHAQSYYSFTPAQHFLPYGRDEVLNQAIKRLGKKASGVRVNLAQFFGERRQTADLLASTASRIYQSARALRRGDLTSFTRSLSLSGTETRKVRQSWARVERTPVSKRLSSHWLEFVYGWKPLLSDAFDSAELIAQKSIEQVRDCDTLRASAFQGRSLSQTQLEELMGTKMFTKFDSLFKARFSAAYRLESQAQQTLAQTGLTNPALLAWELLPYSFVVDWFVPVGTYLESLTAFDGFDLIPGRSYLTTKLSQKFRLDYSRMSQDGDFGVKYSGVTDKETFTFSRQGLVEWPTHLLRVRSPIGGAPMQRFLTAASLLRVLFR